MIPLRVSRDSPKGIDAAYADGKFVVTNLVNSMGKPVSKVSFLVQPKLPESEIDSDEKNTASDPLQ